VATRAEIQAALAQYEKTGNQDAARRLKATLDAMPAGSDGRSFGAPKAAPPPSLGDRAAQLASLDTTKQGGILEAVAGTAETAGTLVTGAVAAPIAGLGAGIYETARQVLAGNSVQSGTEGDRAVTDAAERASQAATYLPRTQTGRSQVAAIGKAIAPVADELIALGPLAAEAPTIMQTARTAARAGQAAAESTGLPAAAAEAAARAGTAVTEGASAVRDGARAAAARAGAALERPAPPGPDNAPPSAGAAGVPPADVRRAGAAELGFTDDARLTKGQATQDTVEIGFEREQAKNLERGAEIRQRFENQARRAELVFDDFVDKTGGSVPDFSGGGKVALGSKIQKALSEGSAKQKAEVRVKYARAEKEEGGLATNGGTVAQYLTDNASARGTAPILKAAQAEAKRLGIAKDGTGQTTDIKTLYELRKFISQNAGREGSNAYHGGELKKLIDERIATDGGPLYKQATEAHARYSSQYKDASLVNGILENKPGSPDRIIAADQVLNRIIADSTSVEEIKHIRRLLQTHGGEDGIAAFKDLQAGGIEYLRDITYKRARPGPNGTLRPNATQLNNAVNKLDQGGKLDALYGTQGAEKIRLFRDVVRAIENVEGSNLSGTGNVLLEFLESIPVGGKSVTVGRKLFNAVDGQIRDRKLRARLKENLQ
jgi:hypothetical protein